MTRQDKAEVLRLLRLLDEATDADGEIAGHRDGRINCARIEPLSNSINRERNGAKSGNEQ